MEEKGRFNLWEQKRREKKQEAATQEYEAW